MYDMSEKDILMKLNLIFRDVFEDETIVVNEETVSDDIEAWDSLEHINLIIEIENAFAFKFSMEEVSTLKNVGEIVDVILKKSKQN